MSIHRQMKNPDVLEMIRMRAEIQLKSLVEQAREASRQVVQDLVWVRKYPDNGSFRDALVESKRRRAHAMWEAKSLRWVITGQRTKAENRKSERFFAVIKAARIAQEGGAR